MFNEYNSARVGLRYAFTDAPIADPILRKFDKVLSKDIGLKICQAFCYLCTTRENIWRNRTKTNFTGCQYLQRCSHTYYPKTVINVLADALAPDVDRPITGQVRTTKIKHLPNYLQINSLYELSLTSLKLVDSISFEFADYHMYIFIKQNATGLQAIFHHYN